jgi:hypothetical protein
MGIGAPLVIRKKERKKEYLFIFLRHLQAHGIAIGTEFDVNTLVGGYVYIVHHVKALERHKQRICDLSVVLFLWCARGRRVAGYGHRPCLTPETLLGPVPLNLRICTDDIYSVIRALLSTGGKGKGGEVTYWYRTLYINRG